MMGKSQKAATKRDPKASPPAAIETRPAAEWGDCDCCGQHLPIVAETGMCGVCTFGEADAMFDI
jgi:hypothetical protein